MVASAAGQAGCTGLPDELDDANEAFFEELGEQEEDLSEDDGKDSHSLPNVRALTGQDISAAKFADIVLPLPGSDVVYPEYLQAVYEELSESLLGFPLAHFASCKLVPLKGSYRHASVCPKDFEWHTVVPEPQSTSALLESDVAQLLRDRPVNAELREGVAAAPITGPEVANTLPRATTDAEPGTAAVVFSCVLPPSSYLTMFLREVMKQTTAPPTQ